MATASAESNSYSRPGALMKESYPDILDSRFEYVKRRMWKQPIEGLKYWNQVSTNKDTYRTSYLGGLGIVPKSRDVDRLPIGHNVPGFDGSYTPEVYRLSVRIEQRLRETDEFNTIDKMLMDLNQAMKDTIELYAAYPFNTAFATTVEWTCADGMNLVDTDRPFELPGAGTWDNEDTSSTLTSAAVGTMRLNFAKTLNERGLKRPIIMNKIVIPPDLEDTAITELGSALKPGGSLNDKNPQTEYNISYEVWHYLTSSAYWFGMGPKDNLYELNWVWGVKPQSASYDPADSPNVYARYIRSAFVTGADRPMSLRGNQGS